MIKNAQLLKKFIIFAAQKYVKMNKVYKKLTQLTGILSVGVMLTGCLGSKEESEYIQTNAGNALVTKFALKDNSAVAKSLSSYAFTVDHYGQSDPVLHALYPNDGIIFNADSLPYGAIPDSVKVTIGLNAPKTVHFNLYNREGVLKQFSNYANDSALWFASYPDVRLTVTSRDEQVVKTYHVKVNVHKVRTDTIVWRTYNQAVWDDLEIKQQRVDTLNGKMLWFVKDVDGGYRMKSNELRNMGEWSNEQQLASLTGVNLDLETLYGARGVLYAVNTDDNSLWTSTDGIAWSQKNNSMKFLNILGVLQEVMGDNIDPYYWHPDQLVTLVDVEGEFKVRYSEDNGKTWTDDGKDDKSVPAEFPVKGFVRPVGTVARPSLGNVSSRLTLVGGVNKNGELLKSVWCCERKVWADVTSQGSSLPPMSGGSLLRYTLDSDKPHTFWILWPGLLEGGKVSNVIYCSEDNGVSWHKMKDRYGRRAFADTSTLEAVACSSAFYDPKSYQMYFMGGKREDGTESTAMFGGVYSNLTFQKIK